MAELLPAAAWSEDVLPGMSWDDVHVQLPWLFFSNFIFIFNFFVLFLASSHSYSADQVRVWDTEEVSGSVRAHDDVAAARERPGLRTVISDFAA